MDNGQLKIDNTRLPKGWEVKKFGNICDFVRGPFGGSLKKSIFRPSGFAVYEQQHAIYDQFDSIRYFIDAKKYKEMNRFDLKSGDLIMSCSGTMGKVAIVPDNHKKGIINQALLKISPHKELLNQFLKLWMSSASFQIALSKRTKGAAIKNVASVKVLKEIQIPVPPLSEQKRIVKILDKAFGAIDKAKENAEKNLHNAKELFESYLNGIFANPGEDWEEKRLGKVCVVKGGKRVPKGYKFENEPTNYPYISVKDFNDDGTINTTSLKYLSKSIYERIKTYTITSNDIYISIAGTIGKTGFIPKELDGANLTENACKLILQRNIYKNFIYHFTLSNSFQTQVDLNTRVSAQPKLSLERLKTIIIPVPSLSEQKSIVSKLDALLAETKRLEKIYQQKIADVEELKKSILQKAFEGEL